MGIDPDNMTDADRQRIQGMREAAGNQGGRGPPGGSGGATPALFNATQPTMNITVTRMNITSVSNNITTSMPLINSTWDNLTNNIMNNDTFTNHLNESSSAA